jgi:hypothetical protein
LSTQWRLFPYRPRPPSTEWDAHRSVHKRPVPVALGWAEPDVYPLASYEFRVVCHHWPVVFGPSEAEVANFELIAMRVGAVGL